MLTRISRRLLSIILSVVMLMGLLPVTTIPVSAATLSGIPDGFGLSAEISSDGTWKVTETGPLAIQGYVAGEGSCLGDGSPKETEMIITNTSGVPKVLTCNYSFKIENDGLFYIDGVVEQHDTDAKQGTVTKTGSIKRNMAPGDTITFKLESAAGSESKETLNLTAITLADPPASDITFLAPTGGTITANSSSVTADTTINQITIPVTATPASDYEFLAWMDVDTGERLSAAASTSITFDKETTVQAVFVPKSNAAAWFLVAKSYMFDDLNEACTFAASASDKTVVLMNSGTVATGDYTIPADVAVLVPYSSANLFRGVAAEYTLEGYQVGASDFPPSPEPSVIRANDHNANPRTEFRRLTLAANTTITVNGSLEVSGQTHSLGKGQWGMYGLIQMGSGSKITINNGGNLFCWGYIRGSGTVEALSGATVYEPFDVNDYPSAGANTMSSMNEGNVLAFKEYTIHGVEVPMTVHYGAVDKGYFFVSGYMIGYNALYLTIVGTEATSVMQLTDGYYTRKISNGRMISEVNGNTVLNPSKIVLGKDGIEYKVDMERTGLCIPSNWDLILKSGTNVTTKLDLPLLAGSTMTVEKDANFVIDTGKSVYLFDAETDPSSISADAVLNLNGTITVNGGLYTTAKAQITTSGGTGVIVNNAVGTKASVKLKATDSTTADYAVTPAKLRNGDTTVLDTAKGGANTYTYTAGKWVCTTHIDSDPVDGTCDVCKTVLCAHETMNTVVTDPTCTDKGYTTHSCANCAYSYTDTEVAALGHTGGTATCKTQAVCGTCSQPYGELNASNHEGTDSWTTKNTTQHEKTYSCCGAKTVALENHEWANGTCSECGYTCTHSGGTATCKTLATCSACGLSYGNLAPDNHESEGLTWTKTETQHSAVHSCCQGTAVALENHEWSDGGCTECGYACEHSNCNSVVTPPGCKTDGYTTHTCSACGYSYKDTPVSALGHDFTGNWINTDPDSHWKKCSRCDEIDQSAAHGYDNACDASCDTCGYTRTASDHVYDNDCDTTCNVCGAVREVAGHSYGNPTFAWGDNYSCTATFTCTSCQHPEVASCAVTQTTTDPKCGVAGETVYTATATFNGKEYINVDEKTVEVPALEHDWDEGEETTPASCETEGVKTFTCQRTGCGTTKTEPIPATGHSWNIADVDKPISWIPKENGGYDCQVSGTCGVCYATTTVKATEVTGEISKDATCISAGETTYTAVFAEADNVWINGPLSTIFTDIQKLGHDYTSEVTTQPTCTAAGIKTYTCQRTDCGHTYTEAVDALGHDPVNHEAKAPTCTEIGWGAYQTCSRCDYTTYEEIAATGHSYESVVTAPTCTEAGYTTYTCACGDTYVADQVEANGHKYEAVVTAPTCTEKGFTTYTCHCGDSYTDDEVAATGHNYVGTVTTQPTCTETGVETFECSDCGDSYTEEVPAEGHSWTVGAAVWSGDKENGYSCSVTRTCSCNASESAVAIGIETTVALEPTLNALGKTTYTAVFTEEQNWANVETAVRTLDDIPMLPAEAKIGQTRYATLEDAIREAQEGDTIILLSKVSVEGDETWDLSGKILEIPSFEGNYGVVVKGSLTIAGGTFQMTGPYGIGVQSGAALTVNGGTFNAKENVNDYMIGNWGTTVINDGEFNGWYCCVNNFAGTTQITGGSFKVSSPAQEIEGVTYEPWEILGDTGISISGGSFGNEPYEGDLAEGYCPWLTEGLYVVKAHSFTEEVNGTRVDATCKETGSVTMKCANCDETQEKTLEIDPDAHKATTVPGKTATCTETGLTEGAKCSVCGETLTAQEEIPALGHKWSDGNCTVCGTDCEHNYVDGVCGVCGKTGLLVELSAIEVSFDAEILLWTYFIIPDELLNDDNAYVVVTKNGAWGDVVTTITMSELREAGPTAYGDYKVEQGVASGEMGRSITVQFVDGNGKNVNIRDYVDGSVADKISRTVVDYAKRLLDNGSSKQKALVSAMLTYGGYSQIKFGVDAENPVYNVLSEYGIQIPTLSDISSDDIEQSLVKSANSNGLTYTAQEAYLDSAIYHRIYFKLDAGQAIENFKFEVTKVDVNGKTYTETVETVGYDASYNEYYVDILDIPAAYLDYMYTVTATNIQTSEIYEVSTSVLVWAKLIMGNARNPVSQINLAKAVYYYNQAANTFFGK